MPACDDMAEIVEFPAASVPVTVTLGGDRAARASSRREIDATVGSHERDNIRTCRVVAADLIVDRRRRACRARAECVEGRNAGLVIQIPAYVRRRAVAGPSDGDEI